MWTALIIIVWILGFIIGEAVPFFADLLSLISSLFDSFFGLIFCKCLDLPRLVWHIRFFLLTLCDRGICIPDS